MDFRVSLSRSLRRDDGSLLPVGAQVQTGLLTTASKRRYFSGKTYRWLTYALVLSHLFLHPTRSGCGSRASTLDLSSRNLSQKLSVAADLLAQVTHVVIHSTIHLLIHLLSLTYPFANSFGLPSSTLQHPEPSTCLLLPHPQPQQVICSHVIWFP